MRLKHHKQIVNMLYNEWDLCKKASGAKGTVCAWIYWFEILSCVEKYVVEKRNDEIIGICGYSNFYSKKYLLRKKFFYLLKKILIWSPLIKNKEAIYKYDMDYDYLPKELEDKYDGELTILIVKKEYRGQNIGDKLISETFALASKDNMRRIYILSDESCNYGFYEKENLKKIYEVIIPNGEPDRCGDDLSEIGFIYEKSFNI